MFTALVIIGGMCEIAEHYGGIADKMCVCVCEGQKGYPTGGGGKAFRFKRRQKGTVPVAKTSQVWDQRFSSELRLVSFE